jgi:hypothetical protein
MQEIDESVGFIAEITNAKVARKRGGVKENATNSRIFHAGIIGTLAVVSKRRRLTLFNQTSEEPRQEDRRKHGRRLPKRTETRRKS